MTRALSAALWALASVLLLAPRDGAAEDIAYRDPSGVQKWVIEGSQNLPVQLYTLDASGARVALKAGAQPLSIAAWSVGAAGAASNNRRL